MKQLMLGVVCLWIFLPSHSTAQRGGPGGFGGQSGGGAGLHGGVLVGSGFRGNQGFRGGLTGLPPLRPIPPLDRFGNFNQIQKHGNGGRDSELSRSQSATRTRGTITAELKGR